MYLWWKGQLSKAMRTFAETLGLHSFPLEGCSWEPGNPTLLAQTMPFGHCLPHRCFLFSYFGLCLSPQLVKDAEILGGLWAFLGSK